VIEHAEAAGFEVKDYGQVSADVSDLAAQGKLFSVDANRNSWATSEAIVAGGGKLRVEASPITMMKAIKNDVELQGCAQAHVIDAVAMVKFLRWLEEAVGQGQHLTEVSVSTRLLAFRQAHPSFVTPSFATIAGFASNGAIIHYHPQEGSNNKRVDASNMFLLDSGGQYDELLPLTLAPYSCIDVVRSGTSTAPPTSPARCTWAMQAATTSAATLACCSHTCSCRACCSPRA
jgi:Xaa-Pro aminopeptidase